MTRKPVLGAYAIGGVVLERVEVLRDLGILLCSRVRTSLAVIVFTRFRDIFG